MTSIDPHTFHSKGPALSTVLASSSTWERTLVPIEGGARVAFASVTAGLVAITIGHGYLTQKILAAESPGLFLFGWSWSTALTLHLTSLAPIYLVIGGTLLALCALTQGFAMAGRRLQIGLGLLAAGGAVALLPLLGLLMLAAANLVAWIALCILAVALGIAMLGILLAAAFDS